MRSINVQDAIVRLSKKLDHLDLNQHAISGQYIPDREMDPLDRSVFQLFWMMRDVQDEYYSQLQVDELLKDDPLTSVYTVSCSETSEEEYTLIISRTNGDDDSRFIGLLRNLSGLNTVFSQHTVDAMTRMDGTPCPFLFHFVI